MITHEQIDAHLQHVPAGIAALGGDLTDTEPGGERDTAIDWLLEFYRGAIRRNTTPQTTEAE